MQQKAMNLETVSKTSGSASRECNIKRYASLLLKKYSLPRSNFSARRTRL